jgi:hypothetical protein
MTDAVKRNTQTLFVCIGNGVIKTNALNKTTITAITSIGRYEFLKRTLHGAAKAQANHDHR